MLFSREDQLTIPPSWTSWSSATMRMMLLGLALGSAHLTQQVSSAARSVTSVRAAGGPLCRVPVAPDSLIRPAIRPSQHWACSKPHTPLFGWTSVSFPGQGEDGLFEWVCAGWTEKHTHTHTRSLRKWSRVLAIIWSDRVGGVKTENTLYNIDFIELLYNSLIRN